VLSEQREWSEAARVAGETAACFDQEEATLRDEIERFRNAPNLSPEAAVRRDRQIVKREQQIGANARMRANAWFNAAAASFNLGREADARVFAGKVVDDVQFGSAREIDRPSRALMTRPNQPRRHEDSKNLGAGV
jgi:hypothetical protein